MKFSIDSKDFKNITERAAIVIPKSGIFSDIGLHIIADKEAQKITSRATSGNSYAEVFTNAHVYEDGEFTIWNERLKRLYNVTGEVTVETTENTVRVRNSKKQSEVGVGKSTDIGFPAMVTNKAFTVDKSEMLETFSKLSCCLSQTDVRPILTGFNLSKNRVTACDAYRAAVRNVDWDYADNLNITIPGLIVKELQKVSANKQSEKISVYANDKHAWFVGSDFTYTIRLLNGDFPNIEQVMSLKDNIYTFETNAKNLLAIAKEYSCFLKGTGFPMYVCYTNEKLVTVGIDSNYRTSDVLEIKNDNSIPDDLRYALNPMHLKEIAEIFGKQDIVIKSERKAFAPWKIEGENGYNALILPVRPKADMSDVEELLKTA